MIDHPLHPGTPLKAAIFDLDGTLVDSVADLCSATNRMLEQHGFSPVSESSVRLWVGNGATRLVQRALGNAQGLPEEAIQGDMLAGALQQFMQHYEACYKEKSDLYPGVRELISRWHTAGVPLAVVTNKPIRFVPGLLEHLGISDFFSIVLGGDSLAYKKPHPAPLLKVLDDYQVSADSAIMVGDSLSDVEAAAAAGVPMVAVTYGYNQGKRLTETHQCRLIDRFDQLGETLTC